MKIAVNSYEEYTKLALEQFAKRDAVSRKSLFETVKDLKIKRVLEIGCGAGQEFFSFLENSHANCFGVDIAPELGKVTKNVFGNKFSERVSFIRSKGETLPFTDASFDVILCLVAIPYMNNRQVIAEVSRVLKPNGVFLLKIHAPAFYFGMIRQRIKTFNPKQIAYPLICLTASAWHSLSGKQLQKGFWKGKEIFQTRRFLQKELAKNNLSIVRELPDSNNQTPLFMIVKSE